MKYYMNSIMNADMETSTQFVKDILETEGFSIVTQFDVNKALKDKLGVNFRPYRIMGACNPAYALRSIEAEDKIGSIIPCNVMLQSVDKGTEIVIIDPVNMVSALQNEEMKSIAEEISLKLKNVITQIESSRYVE